MIILENECVDQNLMELHSVEILATGLPPSLLLLLIELLESTWSVVDVFLASLVWILTGKIATMYAVIDHENRHSPDPLVVEFYQHKPKRIEIDENSDDSSIKSDIYERCCLRGFVRNIWIFGSLLSGIKNSTFFGRYFLTNRLMFRLEIFTLENNKITSKHLTNVSVLKFRPQTGHGTNLTRRVGNSR